MALDGEMTSGLGNPAEADQDLPSSRVPTVVANYYKPRNLSNTTSPKAFSTQSQEMNGGWGGELHFQLNLGKVLFLET